MTDTTATPGENPDTSTTIPTPTPSPSPSPAPSPTPTPTETKAEGWGENWREQYAGEDQGVLKRLQRYASPKAAVDALIEAQKKISDGSYKKPVDLSKASAEEVAEYRKAHGIPDAPAGYFEKLPNGLVIGEEDKPLWDSVGKLLHDKHVAPDVVHTLVDWYHKFQDDMEGKMHENNVQAKQAAEDELRQEWGADYRQNTNLISAFIGSMPEDVRDELFLSTTPDGKQVMNNPKMLQWLAQQSRELNYTGATLPSGQASAKGLESEINELKVLMGDKGSKYWKGPEANKLQARYRELIDLQQRLAARTA